MGGPNRDDGSKQDEVARGVSCCYGRTVAGARTDATKKEKSKIDEAAQEQKWIYLGAAQFIKAWWLDQKKNLELWYHVTNKGTKPNDTIETQ